MSAVKSDGPGRQVSVVLGLAILVAPFLFAWFTLRPGYSYWARRFSVGYAILSTFLIMGMIAILISMRGHMAQGQAAFEDFRVEREMESDAAKRTSLDPNGPDGSLRHEQSERISRP